MQTALGSVAVVGWRGLSITSQPRMPTKGRKEIFRWSMLAHAQVSTGRALQLHMQASE